MKTLLLLGLFLLHHSLFSMIPGSIEDIDYELCYMEMILSNLETSLQELGTITDYKRGMQHFKELCLRYKARDEHPIWITEIYREPEEEEAPPSDNEEQ